MSVEIKRDTELHQCNGGSGSGIAGAGGLMLFNLLSFRLSSVKKRSVPGLSCCCISQRLL